MKKPKLGTFVKYTRDPKDTIGPYALIFKIFPSADRVDCQVVWFGNKQNKGKFEISGAMVSTPIPDCKRVYKVPKYVLENAIEALLDVKKQFNEYKYKEDSFLQFTNLDIIEVLDNIKKL